MSWKKILTMGLVVSLSMQIAATSAFAANDKINLLKTEGLELKKSKDLNEEAILTGRIKTGYAKNVISWDEVSDAIGYEISRSIAYDGIYKKIASLPADARNYTDATGTDVKCFYKITAMTSLGYEESSIMEADVTGLKALQKNAAIHKDFVSEDQLFDGFRVENLSESNQDAAAVLKGMTAGTVIMRIKPDLNDQTMGILLGLKDNNAPVPNAALLSGGSLNGTKTSAILIRPERNIRYSFGHTRANGKVRLTPGVWNTVVFTNAGPAASKVLRLYVGGRDSGYFSGSVNSGFFSTTDIDINDASVTVGGLLTPDHQCAAGFKGEIAYVTVTDELLTDEEAEEISMGEQASDIMKAFSTAEASNTWVIAGGRNAQGKFEDIGNMRNYAGLFEEVIRWDEIGNEMNARQRFVINTAKEGYAITDIVGNYDNLIRDYQPKAMTVILGTEDLLLDEKTVVNSLNKLIEKNITGKNLIYTVIQLPVPALDTLTNEKIEHLISAIEEFIQQLDSSSARKVVVVNHYAQLKSRNMNELLTESGYLNALGHLEVANQLLAATIGSVSKVTRNDRTDRGEILPDLYPAVPILTFTKDSLTIHAPAIETVSKWNYELNCQGTVIKGTMEDVKLIDTLAEGISFELAMTSQDKSVRLPVLSGITGENGMSYEKEKARELTVLQKELADRLTNGKPMKWLFLGDSITHGALHTKGYDSVPQLFEKYIREDMGRSEDVIINTGVSGATTESYRNDKDVRYNRYQDSDVVVLMFGTNDASNQMVSVYNYRKNLEDMVDEIKGNGAIPVIRTPNKLSSLAGNRAVNLIKYVSASKEVAKEKGCILADHYGLWETSLYSRSYLNTANKYWQNDIIHPNNLGQLKMTQNLLEAMGINYEGSPICSLDYPIPLTVTEHEAVPVIIPGTSKFTLDAEELQRRAGRGIFGKIILTAASEGQVYTKTVIRTSEQSIQTVTVENLPSGKNYYLTVEAELTDSPEILRFHAGEQVMD